MHVWELVAVESSTQQYFGEVPEVRRKTHEIGMFKHKIYHMGSLLAIANL